MAQPRDLKNPPVVEAIVNLSVRFASPPKVETFAELAKDLGPFYKEPENRNLWQIVLGPTNPAIVPISQQPPVTNSYLFKSVDGLSVVQSKNDGFSFSVLPPYKGWSKMIAGAVPLWEKYRDRYGPERIVRCSVRFINRMPFPATPFDFDEYINGLPKIPPELPQMYAEFSVSYVLPLNPIGQAIGRVQIAYSSKEMTQLQTPVLLDLDILQDCDIDPMDIGGLNKIFDNLRTLKNQVFFGTLTETAVKVFE